MIFVHSLRSLPLLAVSLLMAACTSSVTADVTRFHQPAIRDARTYVIQPVGDQGGSLEFQAFRALLVEELAQHGFVATNGMDEADVVVGFTATETAFDAGKEDGPVNVGVGMGGGSGGTGVGIGIGFNLGGGDSNQGYSLALSVTMQEAPDGARLFEGSASMVSRRMDLGDAMPYLVKAVFQDFPGENGESGQVTLPQN